MLDFSHSIAGFVVGAIVGLTGVGGGSLMTPLLVLGFGVPPVTAVGTDLLYAGITKAAGTLSHGLEDHVDWRVTGLLAAGSVPAAVLATGLLAWLPPAGAQSRAVVSASLGAMLVLTAIALLFRRRLLAWAERRASSSAPKHRAAATVALGAFIGAAVTLSSVGAGAIGVTVLMLIFPTMAMTRIVGTDIAHAVPITLVAGMGHAVLGHVDTTMLLSLLLGSLPGIALGAQLSAKLPETLLRRCVALVMLFAGGKLIAA